MKDPKIQIFSLLHAFNSDDVFMAIELYKDAIEIKKTNRINKVKKQLTANGWAPKQTKPEGKEFYHIDGEYWVQSDEFKKRQNETSIKALKKKQSMELKQVQVCCPECNGKMYKQNVCSRCAAGKSGYKIRLICENNPDHEILL